MGASYKFTVRCTDGTANVVEWKTGDVDPGKEFLRVATAQNGCSVQDFDPVMDNGIPVESRSHEGAVASGIIGIISKIASKILPWNW